MPRGVYQRKPRPPVPYVAMEACVSAGCSRPANRRAARLCEMHYMRQRRHGATGEPEPRKTLRPDRVPPNPNWRTAPWSDSQRAVVAARNGSMQDRIDRRIEYDPNGGCWLWGGNVFPKTGYGALKAFGVTQSAHRASWTAYRGPIPAGLCVCHKCDIRVCVNPDHLFLGTHKENVQDAIRKGRFPVAGPRKRYPRPTCTRKQRRAVFELFGGLCRACGEDLTDKRFDVDHRVPVALLGAHEMSNLELLCPPCHRKKTDDDVARIAKAKRQSACVGPRQPSKHPIRSRGFSKGASRPFPSRPFQRKP